jgi:hypothetical protein
VSQFKVLSQLMQNHRLAAPVTGNSQIAAARDGSGEISAFSIGSSGRVYQTYPDATSDTDWSVRDLSYPGTATAIACYADNDGTILLVAADGKTGIHQLIVPASTASPLPKWTSLPSIAAQSIAIGMSVAGAPAVCALSSAQNIYWLQIANGAYTWGRGLRTTSPLTPITAWAYAQVYDTEEWSAGPVTGAVWTPEPAGDPPKALFSRGWWGASDYGCQAAGDFTAVSTFMDAQGRFDVFAVNSADSGVYYLQAPVGTQSYEFTSTQISGSILASAVAAGHYLYPNGDGTTTPYLEAFILDTGGHLCIARQAAPPGTGWDDCLVLDEQLQFTRICTALTGVGNSEVFAIASDFSLYHVWQDPETSDWNFDQIQVAFDGQLEDVPTYQTIVSGTDANGQPLVYADASVSAVNGDSVYLEINGQGTIVGAGAPWTGTTDAKGSLVISQLTSALASPVLQVTIAGVQSIPPFDASGTVQNTLTTLTSQQLIASGVLPAQFESEADTVVSGLQQAMGMVPPAAAPAGLAVHPGSTMAVLSGGGKARASTQAWSYDVSRGRPVFQLLSDAEADAAIAKARALPSLVGGVFDTLEDAWGDVVSAVKHGAAALQTWVVKGAEVTLTLLVNGANWFYSSVVNLVEDALDLVEQILTTVQVFFEDLFDWLGFIFNWQNILRTQQAVAYTVSQGLAFLQQAAGVIQQKFDANIQTFVTTQLPTLFSQAENAFGANTSYGLFLSQAQQQPLQGLDAPPAQLMTNHLLQNAASATSGSSSASPVAADALGSVSSTLNGVMDKINTLSNTYGTNQKVQDAVGFFQAAVTSPDQFLQLALNGLFAAVEAAILAIFEGIQIVVDAILSAIQTILGALQSVLETTWDIPVLSQIYQRMTISSGNPKGLTLSAMSLMTLLIAAPATVVYSAINDAPPFPDDASVTAFQASFSASTLLANSGLGSGAATSAAVPSVATEPSGPAAGVTAAAGSNAAAIMGYCHASMLGITAAFEPPLDLQLPLGIDLSELTSFSPVQSVAEVYTVLARTNLLLEIAGVALSVPWVAGPQPWATNQPAAWGSYGWIVSAVKASGDSVFYLVADKLPRQAGDPGTVFEFIFGFLEVVPAIMQTYEGAHVAGSAGIVQSFGDMLRIIRLKEFVEESGGLTLAAIAGADFVGNLAQCGLTLAAAMDTAPTPALVRGVGGH